MGTALDVLVMHTSSGTLINTMCNLVYCKGKLRAGITWKQKELWGLLHLNNKCHDVDCQ